MAPLGSVSAQLIFADITPESKKTGQKISDRKRERQGDKRKGGQGDKERKISLSPLLPIPLSPCLLVLLPLCPYLPTPAEARELLQTKDVKDNENARTLPPSSGTRSETVSVHVPFPFCPLNAESGLAGLNDPVQGAPAGVMA